MVLWSPKCGEGWSRRSSAKHWWSLAWAWPSLVCLLVMAFEQVVSSRQLQNKINIGHFVRWLRGLEITHIGKTVKSSSWHIVDTWEMVATIIMSEGKDVYVIGDTRMLDFSDQSALTYRLLHSLCLGVVPLFQKNPSQPERLSFAQRRRKN